MNEQNDNQIKLDDVWDKNINFLIGSGASKGLLPTLKLELKKSNGGENYTIETLAEAFEQEENLNDNQKKCLKTMLFMYYFKKCIKPAAKLSIKEISENKVIKNYEKFINTILQILNKKQSKRRCNIFTTNYDGCFEIVANKILTEHKTDFFLNDGTSGFMKRYLEAKNFGMYTVRSGIFNQSDLEIPQINLIHLHGSVYWQKENNELISVKYDELPIYQPIYQEIEQIIDNFNGLLGEFREEIENKEATYEDLKSIINNHNPKGDMDQFWSKYKTIPVVNPEKWKFHETVFEEHYYQMLRALSYELEKPNSVLISFGFSFSDEHILNLIKRSLSNPTLQVFICCYEEEQKNQIQEKFKGYQNISFIPNDFEEFEEGKLNFTAFNKKVFKSSKQ